MWMLALIGACSPLPGEVPVDGYTLHLDGARGAWQVGEPAWLEVEVEREDGSWVRPIDDNVALTATMEPDGFAAADVRIEMVPGNATYRGEWTLPSDGDWLLVIAVAGAPVADARAYVPVVVEP